MPWAHVGSVVAQLKIFSLVDLILRRRPTSLSRLSLNWYKRNAERQFFKNANVLWPLHFADYPAYTANGYTGTGCRGT